ncbi:uncharacterized protein HHUB_2518 [Halobacterium hubeiense]|uniref:Uncharacterized protein n=1 Tax=Halobacterium hubeiense TaxID=1407499 RepID=A0A0U5H4H4_9EURY|nr:hypothetical protein [Halobacterium hubeiense]CQH57336.1 uncharacterized protein HHUB_2518 [Halobacterium hubeiense]
MDRETTTSAVSTVVKYVGMFAVARLTAGVVLAIVPQSYFHRPTVLSTFAELALVVASLYVGLVAVNRVEAAVFED